ncbi:hypothetical protein F443_22496, partial [Phytophthora nicotianae P1569]
DYIDSFFDDLSAVWERCCSATPWQSLPIPSIARTGMLYKKMGWSRWLKPTNAARRFGYFATYCWAEGSKRHHVGNKHSTIVLKMASVLGFHRRYRYLLITSSPRLTMLLQGVKRLSVPKCKKQPITMSFLLLLDRTLDLARSRQCLLWGSILIGYFCMLRRSEYLLIGRTRHFYCLKTSNTYFSGKNGKPVKYALATSVTIGLEGAKNDQFRRGAWWTMHVSGDH